MMPEKEKPGPAGTGRGLKSVQLASVTDLENTEDLEARQARRIADRFRVPSATARVVAWLAFGEAA